ncbi:MAG TPA: glucose 1-dehydrogenase [Acidimicrobiales bacterium]|nr:glucose 1-dehydrogenase [Acidimicrobiales bacterium]
MDGRVEGRFEDRVVLISGAARGMGETEARRFAAEGAAVVIGDVLVEEGKEVASALGERARFLKLDVTSAGDWDEAVRLATEEFGRLDVLVNNAGIAPITPIIGGSPDDYLKVVMVNQVGVYRGMRAAAPTMKASGRGGSIINISSIDGLIGMPGVAGYVASKFAVRGMTKTAALELAPFGIRVNSVHPGYIDTPMLREPMGDALTDKLARTVPLRRLGTTSDIANLVAFLASDESSYCTGSEFVIDGGVTAGFAPDVL